MKVVVLYRPKSEHGTSVEQYAREFLSRTNRALELIDQDSKEGQHMAQLYDIMRFPSFLAIDNEGKLEKSWDGADTLPLIDEVNAYAIEQ